MAGDHGVALIPIGPGDREVERAVDLLDSLCHYEPELAVVVIDDVAGRLRNPSWMHRRPARVSVIDNPRQGRGQGGCGGLCAGIVAGLAWIQRRTDAGFVVKLDTDALVIAPFAAAIRDAFASRPGTGQLGSFRTAPGNGKHWSHHWAPIVRDYGRLVQLWRHGPMGEHVGVGAFGWRRRFRGQIRAAVANGYLFGEHCQGGAYTLSCVAIDAMEARGYLAHPCTWLGSSVTEDVLVSLLVHAVGMDCTDLVDDGAPFGIVWQGLAFPPAELVERGYSLIHSVKNDPEYPEADVRTFFQLRREGAHYDLPFSPRHRKGQPTGDMNDHPHQGADLEINAVADGAVVYQPSRDRVHYLNHTAALVLELCTGTNSTDEIGHAVQVAFDLPDVPADELATCLAKLREEGLIG